MLKVQMKVKIIALGKLMGTDQKQTRVFISYSRKDIDFTRRLADTLSITGYTPDYDQASYDSSYVATGISAEDEWWQRIQDMITVADIMLFVVSPSSSESEVCNEEIAFARNLGKRIIPVLRHQIDFTKAPPRLSALNIKLDFTSDSHFDTSFNKLIEALEVDVTWHREHSRLIQLAQRWKFNNKSSQQLLRGTDIAESENWATRRPASASGLSDFIIEFIKESRQAAIVREKRAKLRARLAVIASLIIATIIGYFALLMFDQWQVGLQRETLSLIDHASNALTSKDANTATLLSLEALPSPKSLSINNRFRPYENDARLSLERNLRTFLYRDRTLAGHKAVILGLGISPNGERIVTVSRDGSARLWNAKSGKQIKSLFDKPLLVDSRAKITFSSDGKKLAISRINSVVYIFSATDGRSLNKIDGLSNAILSPNGNYVIGFPLSNSKTVELIDAQTGVAKWSYNGDTRVSHYLAVSSDSNWVAAVFSDQSVRLLSADDGAELASFEHKPQTVTGMRFSPKSKMLAVTLKDNSIKVWKLEEKSLFQHLIGHKYLPRALSFSKDGKQLLSAEVNSRPAKGKSAVIWDLFKGKIIHTISAHEIALSGASFSHDGRYIITSGLDGIVKKWSANDYNLWSSFKSPSKVVFGFKESSNGGFLVTQEADHTVRIWRQSKPDRWYHDIFFYPKSPKISVDKKYLFAKELSYDAIQPDTLHIFEVNAYGPKLIRKLKLKKFSLFQFLNDDNRIALIPHKTSEIEIWNNTLTSRVKVINFGDELNEYGKDIQSFRIFEDKSMVLINTDEAGLLRTVDLSSGEILNEIMIEGAWDIIHDIKNGYAIIVGNNGEFVVVNVDTLKIEKRLSAHEDKIFDVVISPSGRLIATASKDKLIKLWNAESYELMAVLKGHNHQVLSVQFSQDGRYLISGSEDTTLGIWDVNTKLPLKFYCCHNRGILKTWILPEKFNIASLDRNGELIIWKAEPLEREKLIEKARSSTSRCLTEKQRKHYHLDPTPPLWCIKQKKWPYANKTSERLTYGQRLLQAFDVVSEKFIIWRDSVESTP